jgi:hypothetical protein
MPGGIILVLVLLALAASGVKVVRESARIGVLPGGRRGRPPRPEAPLLIPRAERAPRVNLRTLTMDIPSQDVNEGQCLGGGGLLAIITGDRSEPQRRRGRELSLSHLAERPDHVAQRVR